MLLERLYDQKLAQASYLVGCAATGEALVIDPNRDVEQYLDVARAHGVRITHVTETHIHADFVSGSRELAARTGAQLLLSDEGGPDWSYRFAAEAKARLLRAGESFMVGNLRFDVLHTPGHTPEHLSFMVTDTPATDQPMGVFTGDFVFAGDVGRPDLLERAAHAAGTMKKSARTLFRSLRMFKELPDHLQIWPGHGAGSACGKSLGAMPSTTLGYEKLANWGFGTDSETLFVEQVLAGQPEPPKYFAEMKRINRDGPALLHGFRRPERLPVSRLRSLLDEGAMVIDTRPWAAYAAKHIPGTINIPLNKSFTTWAGWLVPYDRPFYLIVDETSPSALDEAIRDLAMIGLDSVGGSFAADVVERWSADGRPAGTAREVTLRELAHAMEEGETTVIDVRGAAEWEAAHIPGVKNIPLGYLGDRVGEIPPDRPIIVHCQSGARSAIAASVLAARGFERVATLRGGFADWKSSGYATESAHARESVPA